MATKPPRYVQQWSPPPNVNGSFAGSANDLFHHGLESPDDLVAAYFGDRFRVGEERTQSNSSQFGKAESSNSAVFVNDMQEVERSLHHAEVTVDRIEKTLFASRHYAINLHHSTRNPAEERVAAERRRILELQETFELVVLEKENVARELRVHKAQNAKMQQILQTLEASAVLSPDRQSKIITLHADQTRAIHDIQVMRRESALDANNLASPGLFTGNRKLEGGSPTAWSGTSQEGVSPKDEKEKLKDSTMQFLRQQLRTMGYERDVARKEVKDLQDKVKQLQHLLMARGAVEQTQMGRIPNGSPHSYPLDGYARNGLAPGGYFAAANGAQHSPYSPPHFGAGMAMEGFDSPARPPQLFRPDTSPPTSSLDPFARSKLGGNSLTDPFPNHPWPAPAPPGADQSHLPPQHSPRGQHHRERSDSPSSVDSSIASTRGSFRSAHGRSGPGYEVSADLVMFGGEHGDEHDDLERRLSAEMHLALPKRSDSHRQVEQFVHSLGAPAAPAPHALARPAFAPPPPAPAAPAPMRVAVPEAGAGRSPAIKDVAHLWNSFVRTKSDSRSSVPEAPSENAIRSWEPVDPRLDAVIETDSRASSSWGTTPPQTGALGTIVPFADGIDGLALRLGGGGGGPGTPPPSRESPENSQSRMRTLDVGWADFMQTKMDSGSRSGKATDGTPRVLTVSTSAKHLEAPPTQEEIDETTEGEPERTGSNSSIKFPAASSARRHSVNTLHRFWSSISRESSVIPGGEGSTTSRKNSTGGEEGGFQPHDAWKTAILKAEQMLYRQKQKDKEAAAAPAQ